MTRNAKRTGRFGLALSLLVAAPTADALRVAGGQGQQVMFVNQDLLFAPAFPMPGETGANAHLVDGFSVAAGATPIQDTPAGEAIKLMQAGEWIKAIQAIESLGADDQRLVIDPSGVLRPLSSLKSQLIASMPEEGQRTFRRLNDPAAQTKLERARAATDLQARERAYTELVRDYGLCGAAAEAADALGDIRFEQGRFDEAASLYGFCAEHVGAMPDDPKLMAKRLYALTRAGRWDGFDDLAEYARFRHPDTAVTLGGREVKVADLIEELAQAREAEPKPDTVRGDSTLAMPAHPRPSFDRPLVEPNLRKMLQASATNNGMGAVVDELTAPIVTADHDRLFTLALGSVARLDPETGSDLWRVGDANQHAISLGNRAHQLQQGYHQALVVAGDTVLAVVPDENYPSRSRLIALDALTGEAKWDFNQTGGSLRKEIIGRPLVVNGVVYAVAQQPGNPETELVIASLATGAPIASLALGSAAVDPNMNAPAEYAPRLAMGRGYLFVQTNNGALIAIDPADHTIAWAFTQKIRGSGMGQVRNRGQFNPNLITEHPGDLFVRDGLVIAKDTRSNRIHCLREFDATPVWAITTGYDSTIVHIDDRFVYTIGETGDYQDGSAEQHNYFVAHDIRTGEPAWWSRLAGDQTGRPVFAGDACLIAGSDRQGRIDLDHGLLTDERDDLYTPADLSVVGDRLIRVTRDRIAGYRMPAPPADAQP